MLSFPQVFQHVAKAFLLKQIHLKKQVKKPIKGKLPSFQQLNQKCNKKKNENNQLKGFQFCRYPKKKNRKKKKPHRGISRHCVSDECDMKLIKCSGWSRHSKLKDHKQFQKCRGDNCKYCKQLISQQTLGKPKRRIAKIIKKIQSNNEQTQKELNSMEKVPTPKTPRYVIPFNNFENKTPQIKATLQKGKRKHSGIALDRICINCCNNQVFKGGSWSSHWNSYHQGKAVEDINFKYLKDFDGNQQMLVYGKTPSSSATKVRNKICVKVEEDAQPQHNKNFITTAAPFFQKVAPQKYDQLKCKYANKTCLELTISSSWQEPTQTQIDALYNKQNTFSLWTPQHSSKLCLCQGHCQHDNPQNIKIMNDLRKFSSHIYFIKQNDTLIFETTNIQSVGELRQQIFNSLRDENVKMNSIFIFNKNGVVITDLEKMQKNMILLVLRMWKAEQYQLYADQLHNRLRQGANFVGMFTKNSIIDQASLSNATSLALQLFGGLQKMFDIEAKIKHFLLTLIQECLKPFGVQFYVDLEMHFKMILDGITTDILSDISILDGNTPIIIIETKPVNKRNLRPVPLLKEGLAQLLQQMRCFSIQFDIVEIYGILTNGKEFIIVDYKMFREEAMGRQYEANPFSILGQVQIQQIDIIAKTIVGILQQYIEKRNKGARPLNKLARGSLQLTVEQCQLGVKDHNLPNKRRNTMNSINQFSQKTMYQD